MSEQSKVLIEVENLRKYFSIKAGAFRRKYVQAVESVTFSIYRGETLGLVGESGCGKTTLGRTIIRLHEPTSGRIVYDGTPIYDSEKHIAADMLPFRRKMQIIFQDPSASLDPRMTVGEIVGEALDIHGLCTGKQERRDRINELLDVVGLNTEHANRFPHEFSGSIQSQVVNMLEDLQADKNLTYLFIAHDISVVRHISNRIGVMYLGQMVELAESYELCSHPLHPYTQTLLSAVPLPDPVKSRANKRILLEGDIPSPVDPPSGCRFHTRCPYATDRCRSEQPKLKEQSPGHFAACHMLDG